MIAKLFWTIATLEALGLVWIGVKLIKDLNRGGPGAGLGLLALLLVVAVFGGLGIVSFWFYKSRSLVPLIIVLIPIVTQAVGSLRTKGVTAQVEKSLAGNDDFSDPGQRALANAIARKDMNAVMAALPGAGDLNKRSSTGMTLLMFAVGPGGKPEIIKLLLDGGANPNVTRADGLHALQLAGGTSTQLLLDAGADPNAKGTEGTVWLTALSIDTESDREALELYIKHGAKMDAKNHRGEGPAGAAAQAKNWFALRRVLEAGASREDVVLGEPLRAQVKLQLDIAGANAPEDLKEAAKILGL